ncbi:hypothetical protein EQG49_11530 [Periweissella cryptocerci]|uniref:VanZ-like domain-containing protein n=1 Tax=Periweissella cryptocerci TaxID=2506420 RepID=A0A4P6YWB1_9LACO|nr:VanZ family protein [Periweissella cryptocerci]QBO37037.1 hypothetical protein EQG49_11530 [Periweissella cryptocerci]
MEFHIKGQTFRPDIILGDNTLLVIAVGLFIITAVISLKHRHPQLRWLRIGVWAIFYAYFVMVLSFTVFPIGIFTHSGQTFAQVGYGHVPYWEVHPFRILKYVTTNEVAAYNIIGNSVMLVPLVSMFALLFKRFVKLPWMLGLALLASLLVESTQFVLTYFYMNARTFDLMDITSNTLGGFILGAGLYHVIRWIFPKTVQKLQK